ncbi:cytochrome c3 family protein [Candidatus Promineifilum breve]|uniref:cytochrome c3 family protein n=1 Tax=Candidatus Promineifilum breve TaxID=1806508 RepID=UPI0012FFAB49|nr:cytochrome c3 family protein [Candidatus Promineifilum breve]
MLLALLALGVVVGLAHAHSARAGAPPPVAKGGSSSLAPVTPNLPPPFPLLLGLDRSSAALPQPQPATHPPVETACRACHGDSQAEVVFPSGETLAVAVDLPGFDASAHGAMASVYVGCTGCHAPARYQFPHPPVEEPDLRSYTLARSETCVRCHDPHLTAHPGPDWSGGYDPALSEAGISVVCTDCHGDHHVQTVEAWRLPAATTVCADCHLNTGVALTEPDRLSQHVQEGLFNQKQVNNDFCMGCHGPPDRAMTFPNGDVVSISIDGEAFHTSVHGAENNWQQLACTDCHENYNFPHQPLQAATARDYTIEQAEQCARCHQTQQEGHQQGVHAQALAEGNQDAATCVDCHGSHDTALPNQPRSRISLTCRQCHSTIFDEFARSVHGEALLGDENPNVPTCAECHGVHSVNDPTTALFRNRSPELCASCHADEELMAPYDISTDVFETYVDDFHGTTVTIFHSNDPNTPTNKAVCYDCHGVHDIRRPDDPESGIKENLLETCQQCHPDATTNFSDSWTGHHRPSLRDNPLMLLITVFYALVIPSTVLFLGFLVGTDIYRQARGR